jgi:hypothetical protein
VSDKKIKIKCIQGDGPWIEGEVYEGIPTKFGYGKMSVDTYLIDGGIPINAGFVPLDEFREEKLNNILDELD